jgi:hypothetical protein
MRVRYYADTAIREMHEHAIGLWGGFMTSAVSPSKSTESTDSTVRFRTFPVNCDM